MSHGSGVSANCDQAGGANRDQAAQAARARRFRPEQTRLPGTDGAPYADGMDETHAPLLRDVIGRLLRVRRAALGLTLAEVARRAGVSTQYLSEVERGLKDASSEMVAAIAGALGLGLHEVLVLSSRLAAPAGERVPSVSAVTSMGRPVSSAPPSVSAAPFRGDVVLAA